MFNVGKCCQHLLQAINKPAGLRTSSRRLHCSPGMSQIPPVQSSSQCVLRTSPGAALLPVDEENKDTDFLDELFATPCNVFALFHLKVGTILKLHLNIVMLTSLFSKSRNESTNLQDSERTRGNFVVSQKCRNNEVENKNTQTLRRGFVRL